MNQKAKMVAMSGTNRDMAVMPGENCREQACCTLASSTHLKIPRHIGTGLQPHTDHADEVHTPHRDGGEADGGDNEQ